ncbi:hypothetical protein EMIT0210MI2_270008 [Priestia megaterium]
MVAYGEVSKAIVRQVKVKSLRMHFSVTIVHGTFLKPVRIYFTHQSAVYGIPPPIGDPSPCLIVIVAVATYSAIASSDDM